jgi:hypothetical protein
MLAARLWKFAGMLVLRSARTKQTSIIQSVRDSSIFHGREKKRKLTKRGGRPGPARPGPALEAAWRARAVCPNAVAVKRDGAAALSPSGPIRWRALPRPREAIKIGRPRQPSLPLSQPPIPYHPPSCRRLPPRALAPASLRCPPLPRINDEGSSSLMEVTVG